MKALRYGALIMALAMADLVHVQSVKSQEAGHVSDRERLERGSWSISIRQNQTAGRVISLNRKAC
jgi:hypothetical protein